MSNSSSDIDVDIYRMVRASNYLSKCASKLRLLCAGFLGPPIASPGHFLRYLSSCPAPSPFLPPFLSPHAEGVDEYQQLQEERNVYKKCDDRCHSHQGGGGVVQEGTHDARGQEGKDTEPDLQEVSEENGDERRC